MTEWQLGMLAFREGRLREAVDRLRQASAEQERTVSQTVRYQTFAYLGAAYYALGQSAEAVRAFEMARRLCPILPTPASLMVNLANAYLADGKRSEARAVLNEAVQQNPGDMEVNMLLTRLNNTAVDAPLSGSILGETPESITRYLHTLSFTTMPQGYSPEQVRAALAQIQHYVEFLASQLAARDETITQATDELNKLRQSEEGLIQNILQIQQEAEELRSEAASHPNSPANDSTQIDLTPLERLFQKKA
jgi:tetratricopeptide (TPR) repeat protein